MKIYGVKMKRCNVILHSKMYPKNFDSVNAVGGSVTKVINFLSSVPDSNLWPSFYTSRNESEAENDKFIEKSFYLWVLCQVHWVHPMG